MMQFYKINKTQLLFKECPQVQYNWDLPILVNDKLEVVVGNSLKECLKDEIIVVLCNSYDRELLFDSLLTIETKIAEENSIERFNAIYSEVYYFFKEVRKPVVETIELFKVEDSECVTVENYTEPPAYDFNKHGKEKPLFNEGFVLSEEFIEKIVNNKEPEIEIDMEILKDLL